MDEIRPISTDPESGFPEYIGFQNLRNAGLAHIAAFSGKLWTDHNLHDPGITILEALCYVLTDLDYRTKLDFKDLIASTDKDDNNFNTPAQVLGNNPLTILDYRKLLIDIRGVRNAWLEPIHPFREINDPADDDESLVLSYDCKKKKLYNEPPTGERIPVPLHGVYRVCIEPDDIYPSLFDKNECGIVEFNQDYVIQEINKRLHGHRNLCEDFEDIQFLAKEMISFCLHLELQGDADPEEILIKVYQAVQEFFSPAPRFYTLKDLLDKGRGMDEIFEGRPFDFEKKELVQKNGFIDTTELEKLQRHTVIHVSDLYRIILNIPGIEGITRFSLFSHSQGKTVEFNDGKEWCLPLQPYHRPVLAAELCNVIFFKNKLQFTISNKNASRDYLKKVSDYNKSVKTEAELDTVIPKGRKMNLAEYRSVQYEFPRTYCIGNNDVPETATDTRKVQSLQLQAYLLFYDRLLADYFAQLANIRQLFSSKPSPGASNTYFSGGPGDIPGLPQLLRGLKPPPGSNHDQRLYHGKKLAYEPHVGDDPESTVTQKTYKNTFTRDEAINRLIKACNSIGVIPTIEQDKEGNFSYVIKDTTGKLLLHSYQTNFKSEEEALKGARDVIFFAGMESSYERVNDHEHGKYSLYIVYREISYQQLMNELSESRETYYERRDRFLNHLLARFAEDFTDYSLMMYALNGKKNDLRENIKDKEALLALYPDISANRGRSFDYTTRRTKYPLTGLQRKVAGVMGIQPDPESSLCSFETVELNNRFLFRCKVPGLGEIQTTVFESRSSYASQDEVDEAIIQFLKMATDEKYYVKFGCRQESVYGLSIRSKNGPWIDVECKLTSRTIQDRDELLEWFLHFFRNDGKHTNVIHLREGYYFLIYGKDQALILKSVERFDSEREALLACFECLQLIRNDAVIEVVPLGTTGKFVIEVRNNHIPVARFPRSFHTRPEAEAALADLKKYLEDKFLVYQPEKQDAWHWQYQMGEVPVWQSLLLLKDKIQAPASAVQFFELAAVADNYDIYPVGNEWRLHLVLKQADIENNPQAYVPIARSLQLFKSEEEAGNAKAIFTERFHRLWDELSRITASENASYYDFCDADAIGEQVLVSSTFLIPEGSKGIKLINSIVKCAADPSLVKIEAATPGTPDAFFMVSVYDHSGLAVARSEIFIHSKADIVRERLITLATQHALEIKKQATRHGWSFHWPVDGTNALFKSKHLYPDQQSAIEAFTSLIIEFEQLAIAPVDDPYGQYGYILSIQDAPPLCEQEHWFKTTQARDEAIASTRVKLNALIAQHGMTLLQSDQFLFSVRDKDQQILLHEATPATSLADAQITFYETCRLGRSEANYNKLSYGKCSFSFQIPGIDLPAIAIHPKSYCTEKERDDAIRSCIRLFENHSLLVEAKSLPGSWRFEWQWISCKGWIAIAAESVEEYSEKQQAEDALKEMLRLAKDAANYQLVENNSRWQVFILAAAEPGIDRKPIAVHPDVFNCRIKAELTIAQLVNWASITARQIVTSFDRLEVDERDLISIEKRTGYRLIDQAAALAEYYKKAVDRAGIEKLVREAWTFNKHHPIRFTLIETGVKRIVEINNKFHFRLVEDGETLWTGITGHDEPSAAENAFNDQFASILELSRYAKNYSAWKPGEENIYLRNAEGINVAYYTGNFTTLPLYEKEVERRILAGLLYPVHAKDRKYFFKVYQPELHKFIWNGLQSYPTREQAFDAFQQFVILTNYLGNYQQHFTKGAETYTIQVRKVLLDIIYDPKIHTADQESPDRDPGDPADAADLLRLLSQDDRMLYPFTDYSNNCRIGFRLVNHHRYRLARYRKWFPEIKTRERELSRIHASISCHNGHQWIECPEPCFNKPELVDKNRIWRDPDSFPGQAEWQLEEFTNEAMIKYHSYQLVEKIRDANQCHVIWRSVEQYLDSEHCWQRAADQEKYFYVELLTLARTASNYWYDPVGVDQKQYRLSLTDTYGRVVAYAPELICGDPEEDRAIRMINAMRYPVYKKAEGYGFEINKVCQVENAGRFYYTYKTTWEGIQTYPDPEAAMLQYKRTVSLLNDKSNYQRTQYKRCGPFSFEITDPTQVLSTHPQVYETVEELEAAMDAVLKAISTEGFHVVEHILLRPLLNPCPPKSDRVPGGVLNFCTNSETCPEKTGGDGNDSCDETFLVDPYSFMATVIIPAWPRRFSVIRFRQFFERKLREEAPAHVKLRIVWVSIDNMKKFEEAWIKWLDALTKRDGCNYQQNLEELTSVLMTIKNEYPDAYLMDTTGTSDKPIAILDEVILG